MTPLDPPNDTTPGGIIQHLRAGCVQLSCLALSTSSLSLLLGVDMKIFWDAQKNPSDTQNLVIGLKWLKM